MKPFSLLIKPASADCNQRCRYCFYLDKSISFPGDMPRRMPDVVLEQAIRSYLQTDQPVFAFGWQGGEPTLMGVDFFRRAIELQKQYGRPGSRIANALQTNATLIDGELAGLLAQYRFLVGCSLDGPAGIHDRYRRMQGGGPSHAAALRGIRTLLRHGAEVNILVLVSQANVREASRVYRYLVEQGFFYHQYIPCVEYDRQGRPQPFAITGEEWGRFLCELFDSWYPRDIRSISIGHVDALLQHMVKGRPTLCTMAEDCRRYFLVEADGGIYPCDFFVREDYWIGNVLHTSWQAAWNSPVFRRFGERKALLGRKCRQCPYADRCMGDCPRLRVQTSPQADPASALCSGWLRFFRHAEKPLASLADSIRTGAESV
jgi:uncharacterized protein